MNLPCSPGFGQQKMYRYGGSEARAGGAYKQMVGVHFGCAEGGVGVGTGKRPPGGAATGQGVGRVIGGVSTCHWSATRRGLVVFPRFARLAQRGGGRRRRRRAVRPTVFFRASHSPKKDP